MTDLQDNPVAGWSEDSIPPQPFSHRNRLERLHYLIQTFRIADELAAAGYLISSSELAELMTINASAVTSRGEIWVWRNWVVSRVRREGNQILWQLERIELNEKPA